jgi:hypothetical protein
MSKIHCDEHGEQDETFVCQHIVQGLTEGTSYGFWWANDPGNPRPSAWCSMCNDLVAQANGEWTDDVLEVANVKLLCGACYDHAKVMNVRAE